MQQRECLREADQKGMRFHQQHEAIERKRYLKEYLCGRCNNDTTALGEIQPEALLWENHLWHYGRAVILLYYAPDARKSRLKRNWLEKNKKFVMLGAWKI